MNSSVFKWYVITVVSGTEKKVKQLIESQIEASNMQAHFGGVVLPIGKYQSRTRKGGQIVVERPLMPGYLFVKILDDDQKDESFSFLSSMPEVKSFLGGKLNPTPMSNREAENIVKQMEMSLNTSSVQSLYDVGVKVKIADGPFEGLTATVERVYNDSEELDVSISIFGTFHPMKLKFAQVKKAKDV